MFELALHSALSKLQLFSSVRAIGNKALTRSSHHPTQRLEVCVQDCRPLLVSSVQGLHAAKRVATGLGVPPKAVDTVIGVALASSLHVF